MTIAEFADLAKRAKAVCVKVAHHGFYMPVTAASAIEAVATWQTRASEHPERFKTPRAEVDPSSGVLFFGFEEVEAETTNSEVTP